MTKITFTTIVRLCFLLLFTGWLTTDVYSQDCTGAFASTVSASPAGPFCGSASVTLSTSAVNTGAGITYQWQSSSTGLAGSFSDISGATSDTYLTGTITTTTYYLLIVSCSATSTNDVSNTVGVIINSVPSVTASNNGPVCPGTNVTLNSTSGYAAYSWTGPGTINNSGSQTATGVNPSDGNVYQVTVTDANGCTNTAITTVSVYTAPGVSATNNGPVCSGANIDLIASSGSAISYSWTGPGSINNNNSATATAVAPANGNPYTVVVTDANGCTSQTSTTVTVNANPTVNITGTLAFCNGGSTLLTANATAGSGSISSYQWVYVTTFTNLGTASTQAAANGGNYQVTVTNSNGCSVTSAIATVVENAPPTASIAVNCASLLTGQTATFTATASAGSGTISTYQWILNPSTNVGSNSATYVTSTGGTYHVTVTNSNGCTVNSNDVAITSGSGGPLNGTYSIPGSGCSSFPTIAIAFNYLNANGMAGNVTFNVAAGHTETAPSGGIFLGSATLNPGLGSLSQLVIQKSGSGANPIITAPVGTITPSTLGGLGDGIVNLLGTDYVTFNGIDLKDAAANANTTTQMEWGYGLFKRNSAAPFDGCQNVTIKNCVITLYRTNVYSIAVTQDNRQWNSTTSITPVTTADANNNNKYYANTFQNVYSGIYLRGYNSSNSTTTLWDQNNDVGGSSAATGNQILSWGGTTTGYAVYAYNEINGNFSYNNINNYNGGANGGVVSTAGTLYGIYSYNSALTTGVAFNCTISNNTILYTFGAGSAASYGIYSYYNGGNMNVNNNSITWATTGTATGSWYGIYYYYNYNVAGSTSNCNNNTVTGTFSNSTATLYGIYHYEVAAPTTNFSGNQVVNITRNAVTSGGLYCLYPYCDLSTYSVVGTTTNIFNNTVNNINFASGATSGTLAGIYGNNGNYNVNVYNNTVSNMTHPGTGTIYGLYCYYYATFPTIHHNTVTGITSGVAGSTGGTIYSIYDYYYYGLTTTYYNNTVTNVSSGGSTAIVYGWYKYYNGGTFTSYNNKIAGITASGTSTAQVYGVFQYAYSGNYGNAGNIWKNNYIGSFSTPNSTSGTAQLGFYSNAGTAAAPQLSYNTIYLTGSNANAAFGTACVYMSTTTQANLLRNNILCNLSNNTNASPSGRIVALRNAAGAGLFTEYNSASNYNIYYAGTPSASHFVYWDGTTGYQTMGAFQLGSGVYPREVNSFSENSPFISTTIGAANYLHINPATPSLAESGGTPITGITDDYDGDSRHASTPDIGADEFAGITPAPTFTSLIRTPAGNSCTAVSRSISVNINSSTSITSATLIYSFNGGAPVSVAMSNPSGNTWTGTIPVAVPSTATVTWGITATNSGGYTGNANGTSYADNPLSGVTAVAAAASSSICFGTSTSVSAYSPGALVTLGTGNITNGTTGYPSPYGQYYGSSHEQYLIKATELSAQGLIAGNISALAFNFNTGYTYAALQNFKIQVAHTAVTTLTTSPISTGFNTVYGPTTYTPPNSTGWQGITFTTPFNWDGSSNIVVDIWFSNCSVCNGTSSCTTTFTNNADVNQTGSLGFNATTNWHADGNCTVNSFTPSFAGTNYTQRPNMRFTGNALPASISSVSWSDGTNNLGTGNPKTVTPSSLGSTSYTATLTDANGCTVTSSSVGVNASAIPSAPTAANSSQCGLAAPTASVTSTTGAPSPIFKWYAASSGGTALQSSTSTTYQTAINTTTTFYVTEYNGTCESFPRTAVTVTVTQGDALTAQSSLTTVCAQQSISLSVNQTGGNGNVYNYTWSGSPAANSGLPSPVSGGTSSSPVSPSVTPVTNGTFVYTITGTDGVCTATANVSVTVNPQPFLPALTATPNPGCVGNNVVLSRTQSGSGLGSGGSAPSGYCAVTNAGSSCVTSVTLNTLNMSTGGLACTASGYYYDNPPAGTNTTIITPGSSYTVSVGCNGTAIVSVWIDFNRDGVYSASEWVQPYTAASSGSATINVPPGASIGLTKMRVRSRLNGNQNGSGDGCLAMGSGSTEDFTITIDSPNNYQWTDGTTNIGALNVNPLTVVPSGNTSYYVIVTNSLGCSKTTPALPVVINASPTAPTGVSGTTCGIGAPSTTVVTSTSGLSTPSFNWYAAASGGSPLQTSTSTSFTSSISATTTYYVTEVNGICESSPRLMVTATVNAPPAISVTNGTPAFCGGGGGASQLGVTSSNDPNYVYTWTQSNPGTLSCTTCPNPVATVTTSTNYTVTATDPSTGCHLTSAPFAVSVYTFPAFNAVASPSSICSGSGTPVSLSSGVSAGNFSVSSVPYVYHTPPGTGVTQLCSGGTTLVTPDYCTTCTLDDNGWYNKPIGFNFDFFGVSNTVFHVSTNGNIQFGSSPASTFSSSYTPGAVPSTALPNNYIGIFWQDLYPVGGGTIQYWTEGVAPNRICVIDYVNVPGYTAVGLQSGQILLYETTGVVECHLSQVTDGTHAKVCGVEDVTGTIGAAAPGRNSTVWTLSSPEGWRFQPPVNYTFSWTSTPAGFSSTAATPSVTPSANTTYNVLITDPITGCTKTDAVSVSVNNPQLAGTTPNSRCGAGSVALSATPGAGASSINWYASVTGGAPLYTGTTFNTPVIASTTDYYAAATSGLSTSAVGNNSYVYYGSSTGLNNYGIQFNATSSFTLNSVVVYPYASANGAAGTLTIGLRNSSNVLLQQATVNVLGYLGGSWPSGQTVNLGFAVPAGTGYILTLENYGGGVTGVNYEYNGGNYPFASYATPGIMNMTAGILAGTVYLTYYYYFYDWSVSYGCESGRQQVTATVTPAPGVNAVASTYTPCTGNSTQLSVNSTNDPNYTYSWTSSPAGFSASGAGPFTVTPSGNTTYNVTAIDNTAGTYAGCGAIASVIVSPTPNNLNVTASSTPTSICAGGDVSLSSSVSSGQAYCIPAYTSYDGTDAITNVTLNTINNNTVNPGLPCYSDFTGTISTTLTAGSTFTISVTDGSYSSSENMAAWIDYNQSGTFDAGEQVLPSTTSTIAYQVFTATFTVPLSALNGTTRLRVVDMFSVAVNACGTGATFGETEDYKIIITGGAGGSGGSGYTFNWSSNPIFLNATNVQNPLAQNMTSSQTYSVVITDQSTGCTKSATVPVAVKPIPDPSANSNAPICEGNPLGLTSSNNASGQTSGNSYAWIGPGFSSINQNPSVTGSASPSQSGSYFVTITNAFGCTASASTIVTVNANPTGTAAITNVSCFGLCDGGVVITPTAGQSPYIFTDGVSVNTDGIFSGSYCAGDVSIDVFDDNGCTANIPVTITEPTAVAFSPSPIDETCAGLNNGSIIVNASGGTPSYQYSINNGASFQTGNTFSGLAPGSYNVVVTDAHNCVTSATPVAITAGAPLPAAVITGSQNICQPGGTASLSIAFTQSGPWTYSYTDGTSTFGPFSTSGNPVTVNVSPGSTKTYTVTSVTNGCVGTTSGSAIVAVSTAPPTTNLTFPTVPAYACNGNSLIASTSPVTNTLVYTWDGPAGTTFNSSGNPYSSSNTSVTVNYGPPNGSGYNICVQGSNACGSTTRRCSFVRGTVNVPGVITPANNRTVECASTSANYSIAAVTGATSYTWTITGSATVTGSGTSATVNFGSGWAGGTLSVTANTPCFNSAPRNLALSNATATPGAISGSSTACPGSSVTYSVPVSAGAATYNWILPANTTGGSSSNSILVSFLPGFTFGDIKISITSICGVTSAQQIKTVSSGLPAIPTSISGNLGGLCGQTVTYSCPSVAGASSYTWTTPGSINSGQGSTSINVTYGSFTSGTVCVKANNACGSGAQRCVPVQAAPVAPGIITYSPNPICANTSGVDLQVAPVFGTTGYNWIFPAGVTSVLNLGNEQIVNWGPIGGTVTVTVSNACGNSSRNQVISLGCRETEPQAEVTISDVIVYPNPAHNNISVQFNSVEKSNYVLNLLDLSGRLIYGFNLTAEKGENTYNMDLDQLAKGVYMIELKSDQLNKQIRIVVE